MMRYMGPEISLKNIIFYVWVDLLESTSFAQFQEKELKNAHSVYDSFITYSALT